MFRHREDWAEVRRVVGPTVQVLIGAGADELRPFLESRRGQFDAVLVCRPHNMQSFLDEAGPNRGRLLAGARLIYDAEAVFAGRTILQAGVSGQGVAEVLGAVLAHIEAARAAERRPTRAAYLP